MRRSLLFVAILQLVLLPGLTYADVTVHQDSCVTVGSDVRAYFTVTAPPSGDFVICSMEFIPDPQPPSTGCTATDCGAMPDWACWLNGFGGAGYANPPYNNPSGCIASEPRGAFYITLAPGECCYTAKFLNEALIVVHEQSVCFNCGSVPIKSSSWGAVKTRYDD